MIFTQITPRTPLLSYTSQCTLFKICTPTTISLTSAQRQRKVCCLKRLWNEVEKFQYLRFTHSQIHTTFCVQFMRRARMAKPIGYTDSVYALRSKRSPAHMLSRTPSRKNGSERVYTVSALARWASSESIKKGELNEKLCSKNLYQLSIY